MGWVQQTGAAEGNLPGEDPLQDQAAELPSRAGGAAPAEEAAGARADDQGADAAAGGRAHEEDPRGAEGGTAEAAEGAEERGGGYDRRGGAEHAADQADHQPAAGQKHQHPSVFPLDPEEQADPTGGAEDQRPGGGGHSEGADHPADRQAAVGESDPAG